ncbi:Ig-like domain-containing protein, partial [Xanthobacter autotrophicus]|uniref:Ig-like domain-containing protein n=1 Tax=Xanthobacter autotrophicus TaxID=280 RepID=UPI00372A036E
MSTTVIVSPADWSSSLTGYYSVGLDGQEFAYQGAGNPYSISSVGEDSIRFELRDGDQHSWDAANGKTTERDELAMRSTIPYGTPLEISYDFMIEPGEPNTAYFMVIGQLHQNTVEGAPFWSPPFAIEMIGEKMAVVIYTTGADGQPVRTVLYEDTIDITRGEYYDIDIKAVFDPTGENGRLVVVRDGVTLVDYSGKLGYEGYDSVYWAEGIYRADNATETVAAVYADLDITTGNSVAFPDSADYIGAPVFELTALGAVDADGNRVATISGTAKVGTTVTLYEDGQAVGSAVVDQDGHFTVTASVAGSGTHELFAIASSEGRDGITGEPLTIFVGTAAELVAQFDQLVASDHLGAVVVTDTNTLIVTDAQYWSMRGSSAFNDALQNSDITYFVSYVVTGQTYDRMDMTYDKNGNVLVQSRYAGEQLVFRELTDAQTVTTSVWASDGALQTTVRESGVIVSQVSFNAAGVKITEVTYDTTGTKLASSYFDGTTGALTRQIDYSSDGSRLDTIYGVTGSNYTTQVLHYDAAGTLTAQERYNASGAIVHDEDIVGTTRTLTTWNTDRSSQT